MLFDQVFFMLYIWAKWFLTNKNIKQIDIMWMITGESMKTQYQSFYSLH